MMRKLVLITLLSLLIAPATHGNFVVNNQENLLKGIGIFQQAKGEVEEYKDARADCKVTKGDQDGIVTLAHNYNMNIFAQTENSIDPSSVDFDPKANCTEMIGLKNIYRAQKSKTKYKKQIESLASYLSKCWKDGLTKSDRKKIAKIKGNCTQETIGAFQGLGQRLMQEDSPIGAIIAPTLQGTGLNLPTE